MSRLDYKSVLKSKQGIIALLAILGIFVYLILRFLVGVEGFWELQGVLIAVLILGGVPLILDLIKNALHGKFNSDLLAGISIVTSLFLDEYLAGAIVVLMLSGGEALEAIAVKSASNVLTALAKRMPTIAHKKGDSITDIPVEEILIGDLIVIYPHEVSPVDGTVVEGHGVMDESYLTGEPFQMQKAPGASVISGSINGESVFTIKAVRKASDSRYAKIMEVMRQAELERPSIRRLGDALGTYYTPLAIIIAVIAAYISGDMTRFLAVLVVATPCPLLIAIPVSIIGSISLAAKRSIIIRDPRVLEQIDQCTTIILDKTGTLTYGEPELSEEIVVSGFTKSEVLKLVASLEQYSKHPLAKAILSKAKQDNIKILFAESASEPPGQGLIGYIEGKKVEVTSRKKAIIIDKSAELPPSSSGLECCVLINDKYAATYRFHDAPRDDSKDFISHLMPNHKFQKVMIVSGDREDEVQYLAKLVGVSEVYASKSPEDKVEIVRSETKKNKTLFIGDGINDAPALMAATVGIAFGQNSDVTTEAAGVVILEPTLKRVDEFFHIGRRMRNIALQSAVGGMALSVIGMGFAAFGLLSPVSGAIAQELIDVFAILNALRAGYFKGKISDIS